MSNNKPNDYYELLQISPNAEPETINRVFRMLAQRLHPDNQHTGNASRFREILDAYNVLSDPERRAQYDVSYVQNRKDRWRLVATGLETENDFEMEQVFRTTLLEALYAKRRLDMANPGVYYNELERMLGRPREHIEFTIWYLMQKRFVLLDDESRLVLTVEGAEHLEQTYRNNLHQKRLRDKNPLPNHNGNSHDTVN
jgi:curved DNA-binding protein CbpA